MHCLLYKIKAAGFLDELSIEDLNPHAVLHLNEDRPGNYSLKERIALHEFPFNVFYLAFQEDGPGPLPVITLYRISRKSDGGDVWAGSVRLGSQIFFGKVEPDLEREESQNEMETYRIEIRVRVSDQGSSMEA